MDLSFLQNVEIETISKATPKDRMATPKLPEVGDIRVFGSGRVYPSKAYADANGLEFVPRVNGAPAGGEPKMVVAGNGLEVFSTSNWGQIKEQAAVAGVKYMFVAVVAKSLPKVDLWASTKYDETTGEPKASVFTQGTSNFSKNFLPQMVAEIFDIDWDVTEYVDLKVVTDTVIPAAGDVFHLPKIFSGGKYKGQPTYERRDAIVINPLELIHTEVKEAKAPAMDEIATKGIADDLFSPKEEGVGHAEEVVPEWSDLGGTTTDTTETV